VTQRKAACPGHEQSARGERQECSRATKGRTSERWSTARLETARVPHETRVDALTSSLPGRSPRAQGSPRAPARTTRRASTHPAWKLAPMSPSTTKCAAKWPSRPAWMLATRPASTWPLVRPVWTRQKPSAHPDRQARDRGSNCVATTGPTNATTQSHHRAHQRHHSEPPTAPPPRPPRTFHRAPLLVAPAR
jgi:hypothetical protein